MANILFNHITSGMNLNQIITLSMGAAHSFDTQKKNTNYTVKSNPITGLDRL
jgi:hypothetical protein